MRLLMDADTVAADRPAWLAARVADEDGRPRIGASEIGAILGLKGAYDSPRSLWLKKTGQWGDAGEEELPDFVEFGNYCENFAAWMLARQQPGWHVTPGGLYADDDLPWRIATFDRLMHDDFVGCPNCDGLAQAARQAPVQLKNCAFADWSETGVPPAITAQVIQEAAIARAERGWLVAFDRNAVKIQVIQIDMDDRALASLDVMTEAAEQFRDLVARRVPPRADAHPATTEALKRQFGDIDKEAIAVLSRRDAERWWRARHSGDAADERRRLHLNRLLERAGNAGQWYVREPDGELVKIASRSASPRAGHWVKPNPRVDTVHPSRSWTPIKDVTP